MTSTSQATEDDKTVQKLKLQSTLDYSHAFCINRIMRWLLLSVVQLKIPFSKAFSRKKLKLNSTSDVDSEVSDTASLYSDASLAQSVQAQLSGTRSVPTTPIKCSRSDVM